MICAQTKRMTIHIARSCSSKSNKQIDNVTELNMIESS